MNEGMRTAIAELQRHLDDLQQQEVDTKKTINSLCRVMGEPPMFADSELSLSQVPTVSATLNGDEYFNKPLASVVRTILENRRDRNQGPASAEEIFEQMRAGGFEFDGRSEEKALHGLKISLSKNTTTFLKLPNGKFGLAEWYGGRSKESRPRTNGTIAADDAESEESSREGDTTAEQFCDAGGTSAASPIKPR